MSLGVPWKSRMVTTRTTTTMTIGWKVPDLRYEPPQTQTRQLQQQVLVVATTTSEAPFQLCGQVEEDILADGDDDDEALLRYVPLFKARLCVRGNK